jgi:integrase
MPQPAPADPAPRPDYRASTHLSHRIADFARDCLGIPLTPHLWRHVMGIKIVERSEQMDHAEKLLGHVRGSQATSIYVGMGTRFAANWLREVTDKVRAEGMELLRARRRLGKGLRPTEGKSGAKLSTASTNTRIPRPE